MAGFKKRRPWDSQPQEAVGPNPDVQGLLWVQNFVHEGNLPVGTVVPTPTTAGVGAKTATSQTDYLAARYRLSPTTEAHTFAFIANFPSLAAGGMIYESCDESTTYSGTWSTFQSTGALTGDYGNGGVQASTNRRRALSPTGTIVAGETALFVIVCRSATDWSIYKNGVSLSLTYNGTGSGYSAGTGVGRFGGAVTGPGNGGKNLVASWMVNRAMTSAEIPRSFSDFWSFFAPRSIWVPVSAGGGTSIAGVLGTVMATGYKANINANRTIAGALGTVTATGYQATVSNSTNTVVDGNLGTVTATGFQANVSANRTIAGVLGTVTATGYQATVSNSTDTVVNGNLGTVTATGFQANINANRTIAAALDVVAATGFQATVSNSTDTVVNGNLGTVSAIGYQAFVNANRTITGNLGTVTATGYQATITAGGLPTYVSNAELYLDIGSGLSMRLGGPRMPFWNTAGRPAAPLDGVYGYNTTTGAIEVWDGSTWV